MPNAAELHAFAASESQRLARGGQGAAGPQGLGRAHSTLPEDDDDVDEDVYAIYGDEGEGEEEDDDDDEDEDD